MDKDQVCKMLTQGQSVRVVADTLGMKRSDVERIATDLHQERKSKLAFRLIVLISLAVLCGICLMVYRTLTAEPTDVEMYGPVFKATKAIQTAPGKGWVLETSSKATDARFSEEIEFSEKILDRLNKLVDRNSVLPLGAEIKKAFRGKFRPTIFVPKGRGGISKYLTRDPKPKASGEYLELVFFARADLGNPMVHKDHLSYNAEWRALFIAALEYSDDAWFGALTEHELLHALRDKQGAPSARTQFGNDLYVTEELEAHDLEMDVLDLSTRGQYKARLNRIASSISARTTRQFISRVLPANFQELDALFSQPTMDERDFRAAQYILNLTETWLGQKYIGADLLAEKIKAYRLLITQRGKML
jgi:hypothetical protein